MDRDQILEYNRRAWDEQVWRKNRWTRPVSEKQIAAARKGDWQVLLTPQIPVPADWFPDVRGLKILALASAGGQQGPIFAAAGADVVVYDNSGAQLEQDIKVADRDGLLLQTILGDMTDLSQFANESFDLIFNPVSNCFIPEINGMWRECFRVLRPGGRLLTGFNNPVLYLFGDELYGFGEKLEARFKIPYSDVESLTAEQIKRGEQLGLPLEFGHTIEDQIGGQIQAGFIIIGFYEDRNFPEDCAISAYIPTFMATLAVKQ
jgi:SAM-dependent methyltransferase